MDLLCAARREGLWGLVLVWYVLRRVKHTVVQDIVGDRGRCEVYR